MTEMFQRLKCLSEKCAKCHSEKTTVIRHPGHCASLAPYATPLKSTGLREK